NGIYDIGGRVVNRTANRVAVDKPLTLRSVSGPQLTIIQGYHGIFGAGDGIQCVYLANGANLSGFTLTGGDRGVSCESVTAMLSNCVLTNNSPYGGAYGGTLNNCTLRDNFSWGTYGGGARSSTLNNCILRGNTVRSACCSGNGEAFG